MKKAYIEKSFFKSRLFKRLLSSYIFVISALFLIYISIMLYDTKVSCSEQKRQYYYANIDKFANSVDSALMDAVVISTNLNSSDILNIYTMNNKGITSEDIPASAVISEIKNSTVSRHNINIYDTILFIDGSTTAFSSTKNYNLSIPYSFTSQINTIEQNISLNDVLELDSNEIVFSKNFAIYSQRYISTYASGTIYVLFDSSFITDIADNLFKNERNVVVSIQNTPVYSDGSIKNEVTYETTSAINPQLKYKVTADKSNFGLVINSRFLITMLIIGGVSVILIGGSIFLAGMFYKPVGNIEKIISGSQSHSNINAGNNSYDEFNNISAKIHQLMLENTDYKEKIISIKPYAQKGMLHKILSDNSNIDIVNSPDYDILQKKYYIISDINIAYIGKGTPENNDWSNIHNIIENISNEMSDENTNILLYDIDRFNIFAIINSDIHNNLEDIFYKILDSINIQKNNNDYAITIGVDKVRINISEISDACHNCSLALNYILTGGRNAVYYYSPEDFSSDESYYFPSDSINKLTIFIKENSKNKISDYLNDIMNTNITKHSDNLKVMSMLIDELHVTAAKSVKNVFSEHPVNFKLEKIKFTATIEEIFSYYEDVLNTACNEYKIFKEKSNDISNDDSAIIDEINNNISNSELSLAYLTEKFGVSNKYISTMCKRILGMTYIQYVQNERIKLAINYIQNSNYTLDEIASMCGYTSQLTFRRNFKNVTGVNPSEYK